MAPVSSNALSLKRDSRPDHGVLPLEGDVREAHPLPPVVAGLLEEAASDFRDGTLHGLVGSQDQGDARPSERRAFSSRTAVMEASVVSRSTRSVPR